MESYIGKRVAKRFLVDDDYWKYYAGTVISPEKKSFLVRFDDGEELFLPARNLATHSL